MNVARRLVLAGATAGLTVVAPAPARAAGACQIVNVTPLSFGGYASGQDTPLDTAGEIDIRCTSPASVQALLSRGVLGQQMPRAQVAGGGGGSKLQYNVFLDAAHTVVWGDGTQGTQTLMLRVAAGQTVHVPYYGRVFQLQAVPAGSYSDRLVVTVFF